MANRRQLPVKYADDPGLLRVGGVSQYADEPGLLRVVGVSSAVGQAARHGSATNT
mgnify:CR=1 FL=1